MKFNNKWLAIGGIVLAIVLAVSIGGIAVLADNGSTTTATTTPTATTSPEQTLLDNIVAAYKASYGVTVNETDLQNAFTQAEQDMRINALQTELQNLVAEGKLTQD